MAKTTFTTSNALTKKHWDEKLFREANYESYWSKFMAPSKKACCYVKEELIKSQGDKVTFGLRTLLTGDGVTEGTQLEGNEESLSTESDSVTLAQYRHAVRDKGKLDRQRAMFKITDESKEALQEWGSAKIDRLCFDAITLDPSKVFYKDSSGVITQTGTPATASGDLHATNSIFELDLLTYIKTGASTGWNRTQVPIRPIMINGKAHYVFLTHPDVLYDMKTSAEWKQANREARERSKENPLFTGAVGVWDNVIIHEHELVPIAKDAGSGSNVAWAKSVFMGASALCWAWGERPSTEQESFDYKNEIGTSWEIIAGVKKTEFDGNDYGCVGVYLSRTSVSDA